MQTLFNSSWMRMLISATILMLLIALGSYAMLNFERMDHLADVPATISVTGEGEVFAVPDIGQFTFSVNAEADTADAAQEQSGRAINDILAFLTESGVAETDIKTTSYNLWPRYRFEPVICPEGTICRGGGEQVQDGFEVAQSIQVKVRDTDTATSILSGVGERGATNISGLDFVIDDTDALQAEARMAAIADAKANAGELAGQLGVRLVRITGYSESGGYTPPMFEARTMSFDAALEADFAGPELPMGEEKTLANVTITYEVR